MELELQLVSQVRPLLELAEAEVEKLLMVQQVQALAEQVVVEKVQQDQELPEVQEQLTLVVAEAAVLQLPEQMVVLEDQE